MKDFIPGCVFKNNKYYVFDKHGVTVHKGWPDMLAYRKTKCRKWKPIRPKFYFNELDIPNNDLRLCPISISKEMDDKFETHFYTPDPLTMFLNNFPLEVLHLIKNMRNRQWHLLALFARCGQSSIELYKSSPVLTWMLASSWAFKNKPVKNHFRSIRALLAKNKSQQDILKWLDYPNQKSVIKILRKIAIDELDVSLLLNLKDLLVNKTGIKYLQHCETINRTTLWLLQLASKNNIKMGYCFINELSFLEPIYLKFDVIDVLKDVISFKDRLNKKIIIVKSALHLLNIYEKLHLESLKLSKNHLLPKPPFKLPQKFPKIIFIDTAYDLIKEGEIMHNCLANMVYLAMEAKIFFFKLQVKERAVMAINKTSHGMWEISEIKGYCNEVVDKDTLELAHKWLSAIQPSKVIC